ncbi:MAG: DUF4292 domain-containing protein [Bacteroidota bacterium]
MKYSILRTPLLILAFSAFLVSCRGTRKIQTAINNRVDSAALAYRAARIDSIDFIKRQYDSLISQRIEFNSFSGKVDVDYEETDGKKLNVNVQVRIQRDSVIWLSLTAIFGIEGVRACITPDSVKVMNKQEKTYMIRPISYLQEITALPLDLRSLQDLLVGNPIFLDPNFQQYSKSGGLISLQGNNDWFRKLLTIGEQDKLLASYKLDDLNANRPRTSYLTYADYENRQGKWFARRRTVQVSEKKNFAVRLNYKQYAFNETLSFPFVVPKNYRID